MSLWDKVGRNEEISDWHGVLSDIAWPGKVGQAQLTEGIF